MQSHSEYIEHASGDKRKKGGRAKSRQTENKEKF